MMEDLKKECLTVFEAGLKAVDPYEATKNHVRRQGDQLVIAGREYPLSSFDHVYVIGAGKAGASMALALEEILGGELAGGLVIVKYGHLADLKKVRLIEAGHPVPDEAGFKGAQALAEMAAGFGEKDLVFCLISGGGSALLPLPVSGVSLKEKQDTTRLLLQCGAPIHEINTIRKHLSRIKGGGLARIAHPATLVSLMLSDVIGNDLDVIASGCTVGDRSTFEDCYKILNKYDLERAIPDSVRTHLQGGLEGERDETPKPDDPVFETTANIIIGSNMQCLEAAEQKARERGFNTLILSSFVEGETKEIARVHGAILKEITNSGRPIPRPACIISGGETTVTIQGQGKGGRNQEFVLACGMDIAGWVGTAVFSAGTDGTDGPTDAAGAYADWRMADKAESLGLDPHHYLENNDSYHFFEKLDDLVTTGPTNTNVMDIRLLVAK
jgi:hydroxypyruvate reductase